MFELVSGGDIGPFRFLEGPGERLIFLGTNPTTGGEQDHRQADAGKKPEKEQAIINNIIRRYTIKKKLILINKIASKGSILDFGCGPGRDLLAFKQLGHLPTGLEGSENFCTMARQYTQCEVLHQDFLRLDLPPEAFDGIFANASLFQIPSQELPRVLGELRTSLKNHGVLFSSNPRGPNTEGWNGEESKVASEA